MICPNCKKEMADKSYNYHGISGWDIDYPSSLHEEYICNNCNIRYANGEWVVPKNNLPTLKQIKTIQFINNHLNMNLKPITKHQCWVDISEYFEVAKKTPLYEYSQECFDMCEEDFF